MTNQQILASVSPIRIIVQARMNSVRLPGKVLLPLGNQSILQRLIVRLSQSQRKPEIIVATSTSATDDPIDVFCKTHEWTCFRGDLDNVSQRFADAVSAHPCAAFVRICADSPFLDHRLIDTALELYAKDNYDIVTNVSPRTFPKGESVEVIRSEFFMRHLPEIRTSYDREHVTSFFYRNPENYRLCNFVSPHSQYSGLSLAVDTKEDFFRLRRLVENENMQCDSPWETLAEKLK